MRIALVTRHLRDATSLSAFGGLSRELSKRGHAVTLLTSGLPSANSRRALGGRCLRLTAPLGPLLRRESFDRVHLRVGGTHENPLAGQLAEFARDGRTGISLQFDDFSNPDLPGESPETAEAFRSLFRGPVQVFAISHAVRGRVAHRWPGLRSRIKVVSTGVDASPAPKGSGENILAVGRLSPYKGLDVVLFAFSEIAADYPVDLLIAGAGTKDPYLRDLASHLGIERRIRLLGGMPHAEVLRLMAKSRFLAMASRWEALGLSALEAMAAGRPVIAPRLGGFLDFVEDGRSGLLFEPGNPEALAEAMRKLLASPRRARAMGIAARAAARRYAWPVIAERVLKLWK